MKMFLLLGTLVLTSLLIACGVPPVPAFAVAVSSMMLVGLFWAGARKTFFSVLTCASEGGKPRTKRFWPGVAFFALPLALAACATGTASQDTEKALITAHATYDALSIALQTATASGVLHGAAATQAQSVYDQVGQDLAQADTAWDAGNTALAAAAIASAGTDSAKVSALIPPH